MTPPEVIRVITEGEVIKKDDDRLDIAMIFSGNPSHENKDKKIDVVVVELKKKGLDIERNSIVDENIAVSVPLVAQ